jgi:hypothetical protein
MYHEGGSGRLAAARQVFSEFALQTPALFGKAGAQGGRKAAATDDSRRPVTAPPPGKHKTSFRAENSIRSFGGVNSRVFQNVLKILLTRRN